MNKNMRPYLINNVIIPSLDIALGTKLKYYLESLERSQWFTSDQIRGIQNEKLKSLIKHAYETVPFYHELMKKSNLVPSDIQTTDDLTKFPAVTKDQLKEHTPYRTISSLFQLNRLIPRFTSGSTGEPFKYYITKEEKIRKRAAFARFWRWGGWEFGNRLVNIMSAPNSMFQKNSFFRSAESFLLATKFIPASGLGPNTLDEVIKFQPQCIHGYTSSIYCLAEYAKKRGIHLNLKGILTSSETLLPRQRRIIEDVFGAKVYDEYGGEDMTFMAQCEKTDLYHANAENVIIELVKDGKKVALGETGEVLITSLNRYAMPFIRYRIGDLARQSARACSCGRGLPTYENIEGRISDTIVTSSGRNITVGVFVVVFEYIQEVKMFQIIQKQRDKLLIKVMPEPGFNDQIKKRIQHDVENITGTGMQIEIVIVDNIETTVAGKRRICISEI